MKMKKFALAGLMLPVFAMSVGCTANRGARISFSEAINFAKEKYDPCQYYGYDTTYTLKINRFAIKNIKMYEKVSTAGFETIVLKNTLDFDFRDLSIAIEPDVFPPLHIMSYYLSYVIDYTSTVNALLGYFDWGFVKDGDYLGVEVISTDNLAAIINMICPILKVIPKDSKVVVEDYSEPVAQTINGLTIGTAKKAISSPTFYTSYNLNASPSLLSLLKYLSVFQVDAADFYADIYANNIGLVSDATAKLGLSNVLMVASIPEDQELRAPEIGFDYLMADEVVLDLSFVANYK